MKNIIRKLPLLLVFATAGCGALFDYDDLRRADPKGQDFNAALTREYKAFALFERDDMWDLLDAHHFRNKAMASAAGRTPVPEHLDDRTLPFDHLPELTAARARLVKTLDSGGGRFVPEPAARAQVRFDCWVEQQEEDMQPDHIQECRDGFYAALVTVERALAAAGDKPGDGAMATKAMATVPAIASGQSGAFTLFFDFDSAELTPEHADALDAIVTAAKDGRAVRLMIGGHADRAGPEPYNMALSRRRAEAIEQGLVRRGLDRDHVTLIAYGEQRPRIATPNGMREPLNRRVEIVVGTGPSL